MVKRVNFNLTDNEIEWLRKLSFLEKKSISQVLREILDIMQQKGYKQKELSEQFVLPEKGGQNV